MPYLSLGGMVRQAGTDSCERSSHKYPYGGINIYPAAIAKENTAEGNDSYNAGDAHADNGRPGLAFCKDTCLHLRSP